MFLVPVIFVTFFPFDILTLHFQVKKKEKFLFHFQDRSLDSLTKLLTPIIEDSVKRHIETIAQKISGNLFQVGMSEWTVSTMDVENTTSYEQHLV